jgi:arylsulfatase A-like enzyme
LPLEELTLPQALKEVGYATAIIGKWRLGHFQPEYLPTRRGFDFQYGHYNGALDYFTHERDGGHDWHRNDKANYDEGYSTHLLAREAVQFIKGSFRKSGQPFFLYVPFNAVHSPNQALEKYKAPYAHLPEPRRLNATPSTGAIRVGDWKLILNGKVNAGEDDGATDVPSEQSAELFNLARDPYEKQNLAAQQPDKVKDLRARYNKLAAQAAPPKIRPKPADFKSPKVWGEQ